MMRLTWKRVLGVVIGLTSAIGGMCHGFLARPAARNVQHNSDYCPHCLNGPEVCGDPAGRHDHEAFGKYATPAVIAKTYVNGGTLAARASINVNHAGRWGLQLCRLPNPSPGGERRSLGARCFRQLRLANGGGAHVYLGPSDTVSSAVFRLPRGIRCARCVLRWHWETGNSCTPPGTPRAYANPGLEVCGTSRAPAGESFVNCADIRIR